MNVTLRPTRPDDTDILVDLADRTGVFQPHEIVALREVLDDYHAVNEGEGHVSRTYVVADRVEGFVYFAPVAMTDNTWEVWWIAVEKGQQGRGFGKQMLEATEEDIRARRGRLLLIETSSLPHYQPTRQFYLKNGYRLAAQVADFYHDGDDKVIFSKKLTSAPA
ncbi:GNAT family N-acetyltransferase [Limnoglobus roseus]|uniref:GNAT family N-acetyltransferase n=1 Tax=Limnoglobus roseus TaxID=2598579 RepID=A0A5C1ALW5_9BACT|nr:GNAT family N-acetyltransferase [Limnoglobus roseus]QEL18164.1 GNAT family N-acetyltransferase [Limnoglobus roseus]